MSYEDVLAAIYAELPHLQGKLHSPRVSYVRAQNKLYITFLSSALVEEASFLKMERVLRRLFPSRPLALRVVSPELGEDFKENVNNYRQVLVDFLKRNYPGCSPWMDSIHWKCEGSRLTLLCPSRISMDYLGRVNAQGRLRQAVKDIFDVEVQVELTVDGSQAEQLEQIRKEREEEGVTRAQLREMYGEDAASGRRHRKADEEKTEKKPPRPVNRGLEATKAEKIQPEMTSKASDRPIMGRSIADNLVEIRELTGDHGVVAVQGDIFKLETKELRGGEMLLVTFALTDYTSSILCKCFLRYRSRFGRRSDDAEEPPITDEERAAVMEKVDRIKVGMNVRVRGECTYDTYAHELCISVRDLVPMVKKDRQDTAPEKRVELHMHTNMSTMDALTPADELVKRALAWGHKAVAITDHGVLQSFPAAFNAAKKQNIRIIPGCEGYLTDERATVERADDRSFDDTIVVLDFETTGLNTRLCRVTEIGAVKLQGGAIIDSFSQLVNPHEPVPAVVSEKTGITDSMLADKQDAAYWMPRLMEFIGDCPIAAHNASFDGAVLRAELERLGMQWEGPLLDTLTMARKLYPNMKNHKLGTLCKQLGVSLKNAHRAVHDATATAQCLAHMLSACRERGLKSLRDLNRGLSGGAIGDSWHIILLALTPEGLVNLNRLVSISHLEYFRKRPHMPRSVISQHREGILLGSACAAGELFEAIMNGKPWEELKRIADFYDYLEIQPIGNNDFLIRSGQVRDEEELRRINRTIVALGEELGKPVCATGDVHFLDPHNAINRAIIQAGQGFEDCDHQPPLYFKTTDEMLEEFSYLGAKKCREVVITNPNRIAEQCTITQLFPRHPEGKETFQPLWEDAADNIQRMVAETAREMYGDPLPEIVQARLDKELKSIVGFGYCTLYNIAQRLVAKSLEDGYLVGSRGSVGSSLVARMCGITEVNALPPHYRCTFCHKGFFDVDKRRYHVGVDLPDRDCPLCGHPLTKDGFDIPFEVFLGFHGDKVPDIDLNFSGEEQNRAHHYVEELFGHDHVFRAGTIGSLAEKTAYGYVLRYLEERGLQVGNTEKERLALGCVGVKRTTGQHPGGMVVVPKEYDINQFTAVQHPADDLESDFTTTHFDFNSMHDILVKLDCLGHDDPTMLHMLEELTGINYMDVPLDDVQVRSLFHSPEALGLTEADILCTTGTYGVPEFGTGFVRGMLDETAPTTMEELMRISGLSHGTDVWLGNAQDIIRAGQATLSECVCCRDDIMNYLIEHGVAPEISFKTMESVRKGKGLTPAMEAAMQERSIPEWFVSSCKKIKYMFPKGHAVAYVTMSLRIAWYKVHYPAAYYAAYFTIRCKAFDVATMMIDPAAARSRLQAMRAMEKPTAHEKEQAVAMEIVLEMTARGLRFLPVDLYKSSVSTFQIEGEGLRCPFTSISGLGAAVAQPIVQARRDGPFLSVEDLRRRSRLGQGAVDMLRAAGALEGLDETSQLMMDLGG